MLLIFLLIFAGLALAVARQFELGPHEAELPACCCPGCGQPIERDWLLCPRCKELLQVTCRNCRRRTLVVDHFCTACGAGRSTDFWEVADDDQG